MFRRKEGGTSKQIDTLIGKESIFEGTLKAKGTIRVDGQFLGEITGNADVIIGSPAKIEGNVEGENIVVSGEVRGNLTASGRIEITATGRLYGDMQANALVIDEGAIFHGKCLTQSSTGSSAVLAEDAV